MIDGHTRLAAVVAKPIRHSLSPLIHNTAFQELGINAVYLAWEIEKEDLAETIKAIHRYDMLGMNISMPYKSQVIPFLDELTPTAELIGAVNCISHENGRLIGHNTDGLGFFLGLERQMGFTIKGKTMTILGGGGAAIAIMAQAALDGVGLIQVFIRGASMKKVETLVRKLAQLVPIKVFPLENQELLEQLLVQSDVLVQATSVGMDGRSCLLSPDLSLPERLLVVDVIYQPLETPLLNLARSRGLQTVNGLGMLLYQAVRSFEIWTGQELPTDKIWAMLEERLGERDEN